MQYVPIELFSKEMMESFLRSIVTAGKSLMTWFWAFGQYFSQPIYIRLQNTNPGVYVWLSTVDSVIDIAYENVPSWIPKPQFLEGGLLDWTMFDVLLFGAGAVVLVKVIKTVWDALPIV